MKKLILITSLSLLAFTAFAKTELEIELSARSDRHSAQKKAEEAQQEINKGEQERLRKEARMAEIATLLSKVQEQLGRRFNASISKRDDAYIELEEGLKELASQVIQFSNDTICSIIYISEHKYGGYDSAYFFKASGYCYTNSSKPLNFDYDEKLNLTSIKVGSVKTEALETK